MEKKTFTDEKGLELTVIQKKAKIILEGKQDQLQRNYAFTFQFSPDVYKEIELFFVRAAELAWPGIEMKEANSWQSDYDEYYDSALDNNGYLSINGKGKINIDRPSLEYDRLYVFNKTRMQSFLFDLVKKRETL